MFQYPSLIIRFWIQSRWRSETSWRLCILPRCSMAVLVYRVNVLDCSGYESYRTEPDEIFTQTSWMSSDWEKSASAKFDEARLICSLYKCFFIIFKINAPIPRSSSSHILQICQLGGWRFVTGGGGGRLTWHHQTWPGQVLVGSSNATD